MGFIGKLLVVGCALVISSPAMADNVTFNYQGRVKVNGSPFNGTGQFKFAILNTSATATLWSNDGTGSGEPSASVSLTVADGVFSVNIGEAALGMQPINSAIFQSRTPLKLRVWFNGGMGFQQLNPDQNLVDLTLNTVSTGTQDYYLYVDGVNGNDANSGLTTSTAKKTIQAAVDTVPTQLRCNVTISLAAGVYRESVELDDFTVRRNKELLILGDPSWTPASGGSPTVRLTGCDNDVTHTPVRDRGIFAANCTNVRIQGILADYYSWAGIDLTNGFYTVNNSKVTNTSYGINLTNQSIGTVTNCTASACVYGLNFGRFSAVTVNSCSSRSNTYGGVSMGSHCLCQFRNGGDYSNNTVTGFNMNGFAYVDVLNGTVLLQNNGSTGAAVGENSLFFPNNSVNFTSSNGQTATSASHGGVTYYN